jgi:putative transposase
MITYRFKLYNSKRNKKLHRSIDTAGRIYNHLIALHRRYYRLYGKYLNLYKLMKHITKLKKTKRFANWNTLGSQAIQDIAERINRSYLLFFKNKNKGIKSSPPSFKKIAKYKSFTLKQSGYKLLDGNKIKIMGDTYKYFKSREVEGKIKTVTVKRDSLGDLYICIARETEKPEVKPGSGKIVGLDFGLKNFLTTSDGYIIESPLFFKQSADRIRRLNRMLSRKKKSNNRKRARLELVRAHKKIANQRQDYHFKLAKRLSEEYSLICVEDLNIKVMQSLWGGKISDLGHSRFINILEHQCCKAGTVLIKIPRFYPSSKTCSSCGHVVDALPLGVRNWACPNCKTRHYRDINAAVNILRVGASTLAREGVRPVKASFDEPESR